MGGVTFGKQKIIININYYTRCKYCIWFDLDRLFITKDYEDTSE